MTTTQATAKNRALPLILGLMAGLTVPFIHRNIVVPLIWPALSLSWSGELVTLAAVCIIGGAVAFAVRALARFTRGRKHFAAGKSQ